MGAKDAKQITDLFAVYDIDTILENARKHPRKFILHIGPTNSGKTYKSLERLKEASSGVYLGPLRLLAMEVADKMNESGHPCTLLTGEEKVEADGAVLTASTIEMLDTSRHYEVAVIDEAQLLSDAERGFAWTRAILSVDADEIHVCMAPEAEEAVCKLITDCGSTFTIVKHERMTPLVAGQVKMDKNRDDGMPEIEDGDAVILFSRKGVLAMAGMLQNAGKKVSVIYGALPPLARREEARKFNAGETTVLVSTDAIGMGLNLPIKRVVFYDVEKYDGVQNRPLTFSEYKQIGGRAGRYGKYDEGTVCAVGKPKEFINKRLTKTEPTTTVPVIPFPEDVLDSSFALCDLLRQWTLIPAEEGYLRQDVSEAIQLASLMSSEHLKNKRLAYSIITCPVNIKDNKQISYWYNNALRIFRKEPLIKPVIYTETLEDCELSYHLLDIYHQLSRRLGIEEDTSEERIRICKCINKFLMEKQKHIRHCRNCGRKLPPNFRFNICEECYSRPYFYDEDAW